MLALWNLLELVEHSLQPTFCSYTQLFWAPGPRLIRLILAQRRQGSRSPLLSFILVCALEAVFVLHLLWVLCARTFLIDFFMLNFVYECLLVFVCAMSVPGPYKGRKRLWMPWNWSDRWLPTTTGKPQVPCSGDSAGIAEDRLSPGCITMVFVILVQLFALGFRLDCSVKSKRQPVYAIVFLLTGAVRGPWREPLPPHITLSWN